MGLFFEVFLGACTGRLSKIDFGTKVLGVQAGEVLVVGVDVVVVVGGRWMVTRILTW